MKLFKTLLLLSFTATAQAVCALPDVIVTGVSYDQNTGLYKSVVKNIGVDATPVGVTVGVKYSVDGPGITWGSVAGPLAAGASVTIGTNGPAYFITPGGLHLLKATVDDVNRFAESNETNNTLQTNINVIAPPPTSDIQGFAKVAGVNGGGTGGQNIVVTNCTDSGTVGSIGTPVAGTLRAALQGNTAKNITFAQDCTITNGWFNYVGSNTTIDGAGHNVHISGWPLRVAQNYAAGPTNNIIIKNLTFNATKGDDSAIEITNGSDNVAVIHNTFYDNTRQCDLTGQGFAIYDDAGNPSTGISLGWNRWETPAGGPQQCKAVVVSTSDDTINTPIRLSMYNNYVKNVDARMSRSHGLGIVVHEWNNVLEGWREYAIGGSNSTNVLSENNYFNNTRGSGTNAIDGKYAYPLYPISNSFNSVGDMFVGLPSSVVSVGTFNRAWITYSGYGLEAANTALRDKVIARAGANR